MTTGELLAGLFFLLSSAFCSGTETALTALGDARARQIAESGGRRARLLGIWVRSPERVLSTLLIGNTLVNIAAGALAGDVAGDMARAHGWSVGSAVALATGLTTATILFLGEIIPKTIGKRHPIQVSLATIPVVQLFYWIMWPLTTGLVRATNALVSVFGGARVPTPAVTSDEIEYLIEMGTREGVLDEVKEELLNSVLEFADRVVKEVMVPRTRMVAIDRDAPAEEILRILTENPYSRMPVYADSVDNVIGVLLIRDVVQDLVKGQKGAVLAAIERHMKAPFFVPEGMKISRLLKEMQRRKTHLAVVVDEFGGTSGLVTLEDVIEEIVGEIQDEADVEAVPVREASPGVYLADAGVPLRELEAYLNERADAGEDPDRLVKFPDEGDYETLGGFVTATAGRVPPVGSLLAWDGLTFTVRGGDERRVTRVEITRRRSAPAGDRVEEPRERTEEPREVAVTSRAS